MQRHPKRQLHVGMRIGKTALAVTIALAIAQLLGAYSPLFAGLGAVVVMTRTLDEAVQAAKVQLVGLIFGAIIAVVLLLVDPMPSPLLTGVGVLAVLCLCNVCKLYYAMSLAAIIVLSACVSTSGDPILDILYRILDTSVGLAAGLAVNMLVKPYNNRARVTAQLRRLADGVPPRLEERVLRGLDTDLTALETGLRALNVELDVYRRQHFRKREAHERDVTYLRALAQLAAQMVREVDSLRCMDDMGVPSEENCRRLAELGLEIPDLSRRTAPAEVNVVTNYHLTRALDARAFLLELLEAP